jgi:hypothetical protein
MIEVNQRCINIVLGIIFTTVKFTLEEAMKDQRGSRRIVILFL